MTRGKQGTITRLAAVAALLVVLASLPSGRADAAGASCGSKANPCVVLVSIDGLEPKDVTPENTPFLYWLAHAGDGSLEDQLFSQAFKPRNGFTWESARTVMSGATAPSVVSLL